MLSPVSIRYASRSARGRIMPINAAMNARGVKARICTIAENMKKGANSSILGKTIAPMLRNRNT